MTNHSAVPHKKARRQQRPKPTFRGEVLKDFKAHNDVDFRLKCVDKLLLTRNIEAKDMAAQMLAETATHSSLEVTEKLDLLGRSRGILEEVYNFGSVGREALNTSASRVAGRLAVFDSLQWLVAGSRIAPLSTTSQDYEKLLVAGNRQLAGKDAGVSQGEKELIAGDIAETSIQLLLMRFALANEDREYAPMYSFISEDSGDRRGTWTTSRWDISVFTQYELAEPPSLQHQVQVKTRRKASGSRDYDRSAVSLVYLRDDLSLNGRQMPLNRVIVEATAELEGKPGGFADTLDKRTDVLLQLID